MRGLFQKEASLLEFLGLGRKKVIMAGPRSAGKREVRLLAEYARRVGTERERILLTLVGLLVVSNQYREKLSVSSLEVGGMGGSWRWFGEGIRYIFFKVGLTLDRFTNWG